MRVTIAALGCLLALVRAEQAFAADGTDPTPSAQTAPAAAGGACSEPTRVLELAVVAGPADSAPAEEHGVLWCVSPDDPRCAPMDGGSRGSFNVTGEKFGFAIESEIAGPRERPVSGFAPAVRMDDVRDGIALRLERPPRKSR